MSAAEATAQMAAYKTLAAKAANEVVAQVAANEVAAVAHIRDDVRVDDEAAATDWRDSRSRLSFETKGTRLSVSSRSCFSFDY